MKILLYIPKKIVVAERKLQLLRERSIECLHLSPTLLSAFGAMKIAAEVKKNNIDIVECSSASYAMAAISARKLTEKKFAIVVNVPPNSDIPKGIHREIRQGVDAWIFPSERLAKKYPEDLRNKTVIPPASYDIEGDIPYPSDSEKCTLTWIAPITDAHRLIEVIKAFEQTSVYARLRICGTGKAGNVMPAVRYARSIDKAAQIEWLADDFDIKEEIAKTHAIVASAEDMTEIEAAAANNGRPLLAPVDIVDFVKQPKPLEIVGVFDARRNIDKLTETYQKIRK